MKTKIFTILTAMTVIAIFSIPSSAQLADFSICDDEQGAAFGLCRGGVAVGCDVDDSSVGCTMIAEQFEQITGSSPPYDDGVSISPSSSPAGGAFFITDTLGRIGGSDFVVFFEPGTDPLAGTLAFIVSVAGDGTALEGRVPVTIPRDRDYLVRVTPDFETPRFSDQKIFVEDSQVCIPPCEPL